MITSHKISDPDHYILGFPREASDVVADLMKENHGTAYDVTLSVPPSVSIAWAVAPAKTREKIERRFIENVVADFREAAIPLKGLYLHYTTRTGSPCLHAHAIVPHVGGLGVMEDRHNEELKAGWESLAPEALAEGEGVELLWTVARRHLEERPQAAKLIRVAGGASTTAEMCQRAKLAPELETLGQSIKVVHLRK